MSEPTPNVETDTEDASAVSPRKRFYSTVMRLSGALDDSTDGAFSRGDVAALRREDGATSPTFYKVASLVLDRELATLTGGALTEAETRWARVVHLLAKTSGLHRPGPPSFGAALAHAELAEARLLRLLRAEGAAIESAARAVLAPLAQKAVSFDPVDLAALVLSAPHPRWRFHFEDTDTVRRRVARDFYRTLASSNT